MNLKILIASTVLGLGLVAACGGTNSLGDGRDPVGNGASSGNGGSGAGSSGNGGNTSIDGGGYNPCANQPCGSVCTFCDPSDKDCVEDAVLRYCAADGSCGVNFPVCDDPGQECKSSDECAVPAICEVCPDGSNVCPTAACIGGKCQTSWPTCKVGSCQSAEDCPQPGAPCTKCDDGTVQCPVVECVNGACTGSFGGCPGTGDPCAGLKCGDICDPYPCPPNDPTCAKPPVLSFCNSDGKCDYNAPDDCGGTPNQCREDFDCPAIEVCMPCADGKCANIACIGGKCGFECPAPPNPECKTSADCAVDNLACKICQDGSCATRACINGTCELACPAIW